MVPSESPANKQFEFGAIPIVFSSTPGWNGIDIIGSKLKMDQSKKKGIKHLHRGSQIPDINGGICDRKKKIFGIF